MKSNGAEKINIQVGTISLTVNSVNFLSVNLTLIINDFNGKITTLHNVAGRIYTTSASEHRKSLIEDDLASKITWESCHSSKPHKKDDKANDHTDKVACQSCHIPEFARINHCPVRNFNPRPTAGWRS